MEDFEKIFGDTDINIETDLLDIRELGRIKTFVTKLTLYANNPRDLTEVYTSILMDDNVAFLLTKLSFEPIFVKQFPELYVKNEYGENVINCQQSSSYHRYGVFKHILVTIESVGNPQIPIGDWQKKILKWTMFLHDIGKPYVKTIAEDGTESFAGHDDKSVELATEILNRLSFTEEEKKIILTLIKYHDRYLNEGEITYDNMKFLASELDNNKELFYLLIDVKDSDAKAKSVDVYNKFKITKNKYIEFVNTFFSYQSGNNEIQINTNNPEDNISKERQTATEEEMLALMEDVINRKKVKSLYQHVIDIQNSSVVGYEVFTRIEYNKKVDITEFLNYSKDMNKYQKVQQILLVNGVDDFEKIKGKEAKTLFVNSDVRSYEKYINKPRIYDMMSRNQIVLEFQNYDKMDLTNFSEIISEIHKNGGKVALDNFGIGTLNIDNIGLLDVDYILPDISLIRTLLEDEEKQRYISELVTYGVSRDIKIIVVGVEDKETLDLVKNLGVKYVQGFYFSRPDYNISLLNGKLKNLIYTGSNETIL